MEEDPRPNFEPQEFIDRLIEAILVERQRQHLADDVIASLILRFDNGWIGGLVDDIDVIEEIMMATKCPRLNKGYQRPLVDRLEPLEGKGEAFAAANESFDYETEPVMLNIGNVRVGFSVQPLAPSPQA